MRIKKKKVEKENKEIRINKLKITQNKEIKVNKTEDITKKNTNDNLIAKLSVEDEIQFDVKCFNITNFLEEDSKFKIENVNYVDSSNEEETTAQKNLTDDENDNHNNSDSCDKEENAEEVIVFDKKQEEDRTKRLKECEEAVKDFF